MIIRRNGLAIMIAFLLPLLGFTRLGSPTQRPSCDTAAGCNQLGARALRNGDVKLAIRLFKLQAGYAEEGEYKKEWAIAYNNLARAYLHDEDYLCALAWTHLALKANPASQTAEYNLRNIQKGLANYHWPTSIGGTYVQYAGRGQWNCLRVSKKRSTDLSLHLTVYRMGAAWRRYGPAAYGDVKGEAVLTARNAARYVGTGDFPTCHIGMSFAPDGVTLVQQGNCGFGQQASTSALTQQETAPAMRTTCPDGHTFT